MHNTPTLTRLGVALLALAVTLPLALALPAAAKGGAPCPDYENNLAVTLVVADVDVNGVAGTNHHAPVVRFHATTGIALDSLEGRVFQWGKDGRFGFTYNADAERWESGLLVNPTPAEPLTGHFSGHGLAGFADACHTWDPVVAA